MNICSYEKRSMPNSETRENTKPASFTPGTFLGCQTPPLPVSFVLSVSIFFQLQGEDKYPIEISNARS